MDFKSDFKVIIVGGSVSGLTLAHSLHHAGIDFVVLEKGSQIAFGGGASIGLQPHGLRILDQMGMFPDILATTKPITEAVFRKPNGTVISRSHFARQIEERFGYPILFFERSELLEILYNHMPNKEKVHTNHEVVKVDSKFEAVTVTTKNGSVFKGDIVVGADGINSAVRKSLWELTKIREPTASEKAKSLMTSQYYCAFGVSVYNFKDPDLFPGSSQIVYNVERSNIVITSTKNRVFWFVVFKHDKNYAYPNIPRFSEQEAVSIMEAKAMDLRATIKTSMREIWGKRTKFAMVSLEEMVLEQWHERRIVLLGDAVHKVTPNAGHGGNTAIESAAVLANLLYDAKTAKSGSLDYNGLQELFQTYQDNRIERVDSAVSTSYAATRLQALDSRLWKAMAAILPTLGEDFEVNSAANLMMKGEPLKFIEYQGREGNVPWEGWPVDQSHLSKQSPKATIWNSHSHLVIPILVLWFSHRLQNPGNFLVLSSLSKRFESSWLLNYYPKSNLSHSMLELLALSNLSHESQLGLWQLLATWMNISPIATIIALESFRSNNAKTLSTTTWAIAIALNLGGAFALAPLYLFVNAVEANLSNRDPKGYVVHLKYAKSLLPAVLISAGIALLLALTIPSSIFSPDGSEMAGKLQNYLLNVFPLSTYLVGLILANTYFSRTRTISYGHEDVSSLHAALLLSTALSLISHISFVVTSFLALRSPTPINWVLFLIDLVLGSSHLDDSLRPKHNLFIGCSLAWCFLNMLKVLTPQKRTRVYKVKMAIRIMGSTVVVGPGATMAMLWMWREDKTRCMESQWRYTAEKEKEVQLK